MPGNDGTTGWLGGASWRIKHFKTRKHDDDTCGSFNNVCVNRQPLQNKERKPEVSIDTRAPSAFPVGSPAVNASFLESLQPFFAQRRSGDTVVYYMTDARGDAHNTSRSGSEGSCARRARGGPGSRNLGREESGPSRPSEKKSKNLERALERAFPCWPRQPPLLS